MRTSFVTKYLLIAALFVAGSPILAQAVLVEEHWPGGQLRLQKYVLHQEDGTTVDHGSFVRWHDNGNKEYEAVFVLGRKHGTTVRYHRNGQKATQQEYLKGERHGPSISWNDAGVKVKEENWFEGKPHGTWTIWQDGKVKWRHSYDHGVPN
jgi:antitoxin component YwqK of YwqJK toxin-antitoxin module